MNPNTPPQISSQQINHVTLIGAISNIFLSVIKIIAGIFSGSQALIADGIHSFSDLTSDMLILFSSSRWNAPPDEEHPYGHGRIETIVNISIGILLALTGIGIGWHAFTTIHQAHETPPSWIAFWVAMLSIIAKEILYQWTKLWGIRLESQAVQSNAWHHRSDAFSSIPVALALLTIRIFPSLVYLDHIAAVIVALMILKVSFDIIHPSLNEILESRADSELESRIIALGQQYKEIKEIHAVRSRKIGNAIHVDLHMLVNPSMSVLQSHTIAENFKQKLLASEKHLAEIIVHVEPFGKDD